MTWNSLKQNVLTVLLILTAAQEQAMTARKFSEELENILQAPPEWHATGVEAGYGPSDLYLYVDGGAERYLGYGFQELYLREFAADSQAGRILVEIYRMDRPANAYGIFSSDCAGANPAGLGADAALGEYLLQFWQGPYFIRIQDSDLKGGLRENLLKFGRLISSSLPAPRAEDRPSLVALLPEKGRLPASVCYFHTLNSLNSLIYLGEKNVLDLGPEVEAVSAEYQTGGSGNDVVRLFVVSYPEAERCSLSCARLKSSLSELPENVRAALSHISTRQEKLLLLFGSAPPDWAQNLEALVWKNF
jgi:hypothetical protein